MTMPARIPKPIDLERRRAPMPVAVNKRMVQAERRAQMEIFLHDLEQTKDAIKADIEFAANNEIVGAAYDNEAGFYDKRRAEAAESQVKQQMLADRMAQLMGLDDRTIARHRP